MMISTRSSITIALLASCLGSITVGCSKPVSSNPAPPVPSQTPIVERDRTNPEAPPESQNAPLSQTLSSQQVPPVPQQLEKGMSYDEARQLILNAGWQPIATTTDNPLDGTANWRKRGYNEVTACSGTGMGFCRFEFAGGRNRKLVVVTAGRDSSLHHWSEETTAANSARDQEVDRLSDRIFYQLNPQLNGRKLRSDEVSYAEQWNQIRSAVDQTLSDRSDNCQGRVIFYPNARTAGQGFTKIALAIFLARNPQFNDKGYSPNSPPSSPDYQAIEQAVSQVADSESCYQDGV